MARPTREDTTDGELGQLFEGVVVPEATPSPRRFASRLLRSTPGPAAPTPRRPRTPTRGFSDLRAFDDVTDVLVGPDFVAVTISRPGRWEPLLGPMLRAVSEEFAAERRRRASSPAPPATASGRSRADPGRCETVPSAGSKGAWAELGHLRADRPEDLERVLTAAHDDDPAHRQVAAALLADAPLDVATPGMGPADR